MELNSQWITGFVDGEGCFHIGIAQNKEMAMGVQVLPEFTVVQHIRDIQVLHGIKKFFGAGVVRQNHGDRWCFRVRKIGELKRICEFFEKNSLKTKKQIDFQKFRRVLRLIEEKRHLTNEGLEEIKNLQSQMNRKSLRNEKQDKDRVHSSGNNGE